MFLVTHSELIMQVKSDIYHQKRWMVFVPCTGWNGCAVRQDGGTRMGKPGVVGARGGSRAAGAAVDAYSLDWQWASRGRSRHRRATARRDYAKVWSAIVRGISQ